MDSQLSVEIGIRAALIAKTALEMLGSNNPHLCHLHLVEIVKHVKELDDKLQRIERAAHA
jgi:hypothetical protein